MWRKKYKMVKLKKILKSKRFWKTEAWLGGFFLGVPFFVSGKTLMNYLNSITFNNIILVIIGTTLLGLVMESYLKPNLKH